MLNILTYAINKRYAIGYFLQDGYMSDLCFMQARIQQNIVDEIGRTYLINGGATKKNIGGLKEITTFYDSDGGYIDYEDTAEGEEEFVYRIYIDRYGFLEGWDLIT